MYPRHLHKPDGLYVVVQNEEQHEQMTARGWALLPPAHVEQPRPVTLYDALNEAPIESVDDEDAAPKRGRKPKGDVN